MEIIVTILAGLFILIGIIIVCYTARQIVAIVYDKPSPTILPKKEEPAEVIHMTEKYEREQEIE